MPKQEVGSTKWLGNKMKAKGLQKLRWYCQMCQKQCRDENGFKCHRMSDGHQRQMQVFTQDPNKFMDEFSQEFEMGFMQLMSHSYRSTRVLANTVYAEYISNRHHTHMNSTIWVTLSNFVQYLGRTNQCKIDKTPKGWYLEYLDNTPEARLRAQQKEEMEEHERRLAEKHEQRVKDQLRDAIESGGGMQESEFTALQRKEGDAPIAFAMKTGTSSSSTDRCLPGLGGDDAPGNAVAAGSRSRESSRDAAKGSASREGSRDGSTGSNVLAEAFQLAGSSKRESSRDGKEAKPAARKLTALESIRLENEAKKQKVAEEEAGSRRPQQMVRSAPSPNLPSPDRNAPWLAAGLIVKVMHPDLAGGKYHRKKGKVEKVHDRFVADVRMIDSKDLIRIEQEMLETVIPGIGKPVLVVKGTHKGFKATLQAVDFETFSVTLELEDGTEMEGLGYDEICKIDG